MKYLMILAIIIMAPALSDGQTSNARHKSYDSWYYFKPVGKKPFHGYTYEFSDTSITLVAKNSYAAFIETKAEMLTLMAVKEIDKIYFRAKGQKGKGLAAGIILGAAAGLTYGLVNFNASTSGDFERAMNGVAIFGTTIAGAGIGVGIGLPLGSIKKVVRISGNQDIYSQKRPDLLKYSIKYYMP